MRRILSTLSALVLLLSLTLVTAPVSAKSQDNGDNGTYKHIFYIMMENHQTNQIFGNTADAPYINWLVSKYGSSTNYYGVTHPSLPNYLAAISGSYQGIWDDCAAGATITCPPEEFGPTSGYTNGQELLTPDQIADASATPHMFSGRTIVDQLESKGLSWKAYMQGMPSTGYTGEYYPYSVVNGVSVPRKLYAQKHDPFMYFSDIRNNADRMQKIVPFTQFSDTLQDKNVPNFVWISPDQCHDMHGVSAANAAALGIPACASPASGLDHSVIQLGDQYIKDTVTEIMHSSAWQSRSAIVIAWDENDYSGHAGCCNSPTGVNGAVLGGDQAPLLVITSKDHEHIVDNTTPYNHYSLLATIEHLWDLGCLKNTCNIEHKMTKFFV